MSVLALALLYAWCGAAQALAQSVAVRFDGADEQARHAAERLSAALRTKGYRLAGDSKGDIVVTMKVEPGALRHEAFRIAG